MKGFTDIHQHLIYGIDDDGPRAFEDTGAMLMANKLEGIGAVFATPHITPGIRPFSMDGYLEKVAEARAFCYRHAIEMDILTGSEILYTDMTPSYLREGRVPTMAGTSFVLVEFPVGIPYIQLLRSVEKLNAYGYIPILAHVERYRALTLSPHRALKLRQQRDVRYQVNCSSLLSPAGLRVSYFLKVLLGHGAVDAVASDAHNMGKRPVVMRKAYAFLKEKYGGSYAAHLTGYCGNFITKTLSHTPQALKYSGE